MKSIVLVEVGPFLAVSCGFLRSFLQVILKIIANAIKIMKTVDKYIIVTNSILIYTILSKNVKKKRNPT